MATRKKPKADVPVSSRKKPSVSPVNQPDSYLGKMPVWRLGRVDLYGEWGWLKIKDAKVLLHIIGRLRGFESTTWGEIEKKKNSGGGKQNHPIPIDRICRDALKRLEEINLDDIDELYQLRIGSKQRLWGIRDNEALKILWWDPKHTVYPVQKAHT